MKKSRILLVLLQGSFHSGLKQHEFNCSGLYLKSSHLKHVCSSDERVCLTQIRGNVSGKQVSEGREIDYQSLKMRESRQRLPVASGLNVLSTHTLTKLTKHTLTLFYTHTHTLPHKIFNLIF